MKNPVKHMFGKMKGWFGREPQPTSTHFVMDAPGPRPAPVRTSTHKRRRTPKKPKPFVEARPKHIHLPLKGL
jgi:hypothetical protein